jgi:hypothetical protein
MPTTHRTNSYAEITAEEAERAICIDFEGFTAAPPALVGILVDEDFEIVVLDDSLRPAAVAAGLRTVEGGAVMSELRLRSAIEGRRICAFGAHELVTARKDFSVDISDVYVDGHKVAKTWWRRAHPGDRPQKAGRRGHRRRWRSQRGRWTLEFFEQRLGLERPSHLVSGRATSRLRSVLRQLAGSRSYADLTPVAKAKWTKLLRYNETDVRNLAAIVKASTRS